MRKPLPALARRFPSKAVADRIIPWVQLAALILGGLWALLTYGESVADQKVQASVKLVDNYYADQGGKPSLQARYDQLWENQLNAVKAAFDGKQPNPKDDGERAAVRKKLVDAQQAFAAVPKHYEEFSRIYAYLSSVVVCVNQGRCDAAIIKSSIGVDLFRFLNGACGYFDEVAARWNDKTTGQDLYDYVVKQKLEKLSSPNAASPFACDKFRAQYKR